MRCTALHDNIWRCNLAISDVKALKIKNEFWEDVLKSWFNMNLDNQILWYNSDIRVKGKPIMWRDVYWRGLMYLCQTQCTF